MKRPIESSLLNLDLRVSNTMEERHRRYLTIASLKDRQHNSWLGNRQACKHHGESRDVNKTIQSEVLDAVHMSRKTKM
jgi:hypothetical protein